MFKVIFLIRVPNKLSISHRQSFACGSIGYINGIGLQTAFAGAFLGKASVEVVDGAALGTGGFALGVDSKAADSEVGSLHRAGTVVGGILTTDIHAQHRLTKDEATEAKEYALLTIGVGGLARVFHHIGRPLLGDGKKLSGRGDKIIG